MGVAPKFIADLKALMGDASDNYPGVVGIGPKTAIQLLNQFGSVENVYTDIGRVSGEMIKTKLIAGRESAFLGKHLATIRTDAPITFKAAAARVTKLDTSEVRNILESMHFPSLLRRLTGEQAPKKRHGHDSKEEKKLPKKEQQQALF